MNTNFKSDFYLFPINELGRNNWNYRVATWPSIIDPKVHGLLDGDITGPIKYLRKNERTKLIQSCRISKIKKKIKDNDDNLIDIILEPGDGWNFLIKKISENNKIDSNNKYSNDLKCLICLDKKKSFVAIPCFHVIACETCVNKLKLICPLCRSKVNKFEKLFF